MLYQLSQRGRNTQVRRSGQACRTGRSQDRAALAAPQDGRGGAAPSEVCLRTAGLQHAQILGRQVDGVLGAFDQLVDLLAADDQGRREYHGKTGAVKAVVATASLELGIDIGSVDLVCQLGSTRWISLALQRIGRSGHWKGTIPKGRIFATTRDELLECAALVLSIKSGHLDQIRIPPAPLDILAQQIVAAVASREWEEEELFQVFRRAAPYSSLLRSEFDAVVTMLAEGISTRHGRRGAYLHRDRINGKIRARRGARLAAITSGGAIPDRADYLVKADPEETLVGTLDEDFAIESMQGDIFLLGNTSWRIRRIETGVVRVENAGGAPPTVPSLSAHWRGNARGPARWCGPGLTMSTARGRACQKV